MLIDEAQDLDPVQIKLIQRLSGKSPNVTFFLDYNQAIFSFKGAFLDEIDRLVELYPNTRKFLSRKKPPINGQNSRFGQSADPIERQRKPLRCP